MKTLAGIYFKTRCRTHNSRCMIILSRILHPASCIVLFLIVVFLTSCAAPRYGYYDTYPKYESHPKESPKETPAPLEAKYIVASWYGPDFHGKLTSSGEPYNMHANTCAHKEYPFGTKLKVTNIANNKNVECTVNDRGPFIPGRDLDLSYACAKEIELICPGTG